MDANLLLLAGIILFAYMIGATTGFGSAIIALTLGVNFFSIDFLVPVLIPLNVAVCTYLVLRHHTTIHRPILFKGILPRVILGLVLGLILFNFVDTGKLKQGFGVFVLSISLFELYRLAGKGGEGGSSRRGERASGVWLLGGGIIQGVWISGGPLLAYWAGRNMGEKAEFRSTLSSLFLILNAILLASHLATGSIDAETARVSLLLFPFMAVGVALGEWLYVRLPEKTFRVLVFLILVFAGASIAVRG